MENHIKISINGQYHGHGFVCDPLDDCVQIMAWSRTTRLFVQYLIIIIMHTYLNVLNI